MYTSIALLALWGAVAPQVTRLSVNWEQDYHKARTLGAKEQKPLAVFVGSGTGGWKGVVPAGLDANLRQALTDRYVPVYVDQTTARGQALAAAFELTGKSGLVISDRTGELQAFRHEGELSGQDLARHLGRYCDAGFVIHTTESNAPPPPPAAPIYYQAPVIPASFQSFQNPVPCHT